MLVAATIVLMITVLASIALVALFTLSLKREARHIYDALPDRPGGRGKLLYPFSWTIISRKYRVTLADYPRSRAWASWMFANCCIQLICLAVMAFVVLRK